jgi:hypothetical protein
VRRLLAAIGVLALLLPAACGGSGGDTGGRTEAGADPETETETSVHTTEGDVVEVVSDWISQRLQTYGSGSPPALACPPAPARDVVDLRVVATSGSGPAITFCKATVLAGEPGALFAVRLRNDSRVPLRLGTAATSFLVPALEPGEVRDVLLPGYPETRTFTLHYAADVAGAAYLLADEVLPKPPAEQLAGCAASLTLACLVEGLERVAPQEVRILGRTIPLQSIIDALGKVLAVASVADRWRQLQENVGGGDFVCTIA